MTYTQYTNNNQQSQQQSDDSYWQAPRRVKLIRFTKVKTGRDGSSQRGALIEDEAGNQRWLTESSINEVFKLNWNSWCFFNGVDARPSLTVSQPQPQPTYQAPQSNQALADYYSRLVEQEATQSVEPTYYNQSDSYQPEPNTDVDETLMNKIAMTYSMFAATAEDICPQSYTSEDRRALTISMAIQYFKTKESLGF